MNRLFFLDESDGEMWWLKSVDADRSQFVFESVLSAENRVIPCSEFVASASDENIRTEAFDELASGCDGFDTHKQVSPVYDCSELIIGEKNRLPLKVVNRQSVGDITLGHALTELSVGRTTYYAILRKIVGVNSLQRELTSKPSPSEKKQFPRDVEEIFQQCLKNLSRPSCSTTEIHRDMKMRCQFRGIPAPSYFRIKATLRVLNARNWI